MPSYTHTVDFFRSKFCELLTSEKDFDGKFSSKVTYRATCGHENTIHLTNFFHKSTGLKCKNCRNKLVTIENYNPSEQEYDGYQRVSEFLNDEFCIQKTNEGCLADMLIRPKYETSDKWMMVQLKTTRDICHNLYTFTIDNNDYEDCLVLCICLKDNKMWLMDNTMVRHKSKLNCGITSRSEYYRYQVSSDCLSNVMHFHYAYYRKFKASHGKMPISVCQRLEQSYRQLREKNIPYLKYNYPEIDGCVTDFYINGIKVQEKIAPITKKKTNNPTDVISLHRTNKKINHKCYNKGDNDFYWVWLQNQQTFYIIPEDVLCRKGYIQVDGNMNDKARSFTFTDWTKEFKYELCDPNLKNKLMKLFG